MICDARRQAIWDSVHAWEVHCWKQHEASHLTLSHILIHFNAESGWVVTLPVSLHHRSMECKLPFIPLIWSSISCSATENRQYETSKQDGERSITIQVLNGWTKPNILYIPLIILKFTYNRCDKVKIYKVSFIDYIFIIESRESIFTFPGTSLQKIRIWNTNLFWLTGWGRTAWMCFKYIYINISADNGVFNPLRYWVICCSFAWFSMSN